MTNVAEQIINKELEALGVREKRVAPPKPERRERQTSIFDDDYVAPRRAQARTKSGAVTHRKNEWTNDAVCERLEVMAKGWAVVDGGASMGSREFDAIVTTLATDLANAMEHAGLVYRGAASPALLADMVSDFVTTQMRVRIGADYYDVVA